MPWVIKRNASGQHCVYREGDDGQATGASLGCHESRAEAVNQLQALYASEPSAKAVKFVDGSDDVVVGPGMPFGGPFAGSDLDGQRFSARTDFAFEWFAEGARPALYHHGLDPEAGTEVVGRVKDWEVKADLGVWTRVQLDRQSKYFTAIRDLVKAGKLYFSSGAMAHLVEIEAKTGEIKRWPWIELSLTPTPSNLLAKVDLVTADKHFKSAGLELPDTLKTAVTDGERLAQPVQPAVALAPAPVDLKALTGSYEALLEKLNAALNPRGPFAPSSPNERYAYLVATYPDYVIADQYEDGEKTCYRIPYSLDDEGNVTLGKATEVEQTYRPIAKSAECVPERLAEHTELVTAYAAALAQRTKDLSERRIKEGRVLSTATRRRLSDCLSAMRTAGDEIAALLDSTDPAKAEAKASLAALAAEVDLLELESALVLN